MYEKIYRAVHKYEDPCSVVIKCLFVAAAVRVVMGSDLVSGLLHFSLGAKPVHGAGFRYIYIRKT